MIKSMTGYGRNRSVQNGRDITVEIKSINHRYFECYVRISRTYMQLEDRIRKYLQQKVVRGKIEVNVNIDDIESDVTKIRVNKKLFEGYYSALKDIAATYSLSLDNSASIALRFPDVITASEEDSDTEEVWNGVKTVLDAAAVSFIAQREAEGGRLRDDIIIKCGQINENVDFIEMHALKLVKEYEIKLRAKMQELLADKQIDEQRLITEVALMSDKVAVDEEIVRLNSHCQSLAEMFRSDISNGKKMDFIIQEMNREINTLTSKIGDIEITKCAIEIKVCIEKIREQVQNIE